jgi:hypothetical protein
MTAPSEPTDKDADATRFRRTLIKVMTVQVVTLLLLWWLQRVFSI